MMPAAHPRAGTLEERANKLAVEKSHLQLIIRLMNNISALPGLDNVTESLLRSMLEVIGSTNVSLYYFVDGQLYFADALGARRRVESLDDPIVEEVFRTREAAQIEQDFAETRMLTAAFTSAFTWVWPLKVGSDVIGVLKMEDLHMAMRGMGEYLQTFFAHAALVLNNEIVGQGRMKRAYEELREAHAQLTHEVAERRGAEAALRRAHDELERRVLDRTKALGAVNRELQEEIRERAQADRALRREAEITAALAELYRPMASADATIVDVARGVLREARCLTSSAYGFVSEVEAAGGRHVLHAWTEMFPAGHPAHGVPYVVRRDPNGCWPGLVGLALNTQEVFYTNRPAAHPLAAGYPEGHARLASLLIVPVLLGGGVVGLIALGDKADGYSDADVAVVKRLAEYYALAVQRKRQDEQIRHLASFPEMSPVMVAEYAADGTVRFENPAMTSAMAALPNGSAAQLIPAGWRERIADGADLPDGIHVGEVQLQARWFEERIRYDARARTLRIYALDITDRKTAERDRAKLAAQLEQAQKMEAIGRLAGGIAHDFNNLLTVINGYSEQALTRLDPDDPLGVDLQQIRAAGERAANLTRQLLAFSRRQVFQPKRLNLNDCIRESQRMFERVIGEDVELACVLDPALGTVKADPGQLQQVLMNLIVNARDAMPSGGQLVLETCNAELSAEDAAEWKVPSRRAVVLTVSDTGQGIGDEAQKHLFEPFFTTKEQGKGTGLGLATVFGIVKQSGGHISVQSALGKGTTFRIVLPRSKDDGAPDPVTPVAVAEAKPGTETVLVVEDQEQVRRLTCEVLRRHGYTVIEAPGGSEAVVLSAAHPEIDLLVTDVVMPRMNGLELTKRLRETVPRLRVLYMSGYAENVVSRQGEWDDLSNYIQKPFAFKALLDKIREVLDRRP
jgi:signal transduction histidine kinase/CheY-like chemotaxis protein